MQTIFIFQLKQNTIKDNSIEMSICDTSGLNANPVNINGHKSINRSTSQVHIENIESFEKSRTKI